MDIIGRKKRRQIVTDDIMVPDPLEPLWQHKAMVCQTFGSDKLVLDMFGVMRVPDCMRPYVKWVDDGNDITDMSPMEMKRFNELSRTPDGSEYLDLLGKWSVCTDLRMRYATGYIGVVTFTYNTELDRQVIENVVNDRGYQWVMENKHDRW